MKSLLSLLAPLSFFDRVETLFDVLDRARCLAIVALQVLQPSARISCQFCVQFLAIETPHIHGQVLLVQVSDVFVLVLANKNQVTLTAEIAFHI